MAEEYITDEETNAQPPPTICSIYIGQEFSSLDEAYFSYNSYALSTGFGIRKHSSAKSVKDGDMICKTFVCNKAGHKYSQSTIDDQVKKKRIDTRNGCPAKLVVRKNKDYLWVVSLFVTQHNHELHTPRCTLKQRSHNNITNRELLTKMTMKQLHDAGLGPSKIAKSLNATGAFSDITSKKVSSFIQHTRSKSCIQQGQLIADYLQNESRKDPNFFYALELDDDSFLRSILWVDSRARNDYMNFWDVLVFDVTYRTNNLNLPFAPFTGVNHYRQSILFGCALLADETEQTFTWLFQQWLNCMFNRAPQSILTDMDIAICNAVRNVFPNTNHRCGTNALNPVSSDTDALWLIVPNCILSLLLPSEVGWICITFLIHFKIQILSGFLFFLLFFLSSQNSVC